VVREVQTGARFRPHLPASLHHYWPTAELPTGRAEVSKGEASMPTTGEHWKSADTCILKASLREAGRRGLVRLNHAPESVQDLNGIGDQLAAAGRLCITTVHWQSQPTVS
jgi:hypothetical protein